MNMKKKFLKATEKECYLLFKWVNDDKVRQNAFNTNKIKYEEHSKWFYTKLKDPNVFIYIYFIEDNPVGQIRIECNEEIGIIDYSIDKFHRNKGYGKKMLQELENEAEFKRINLHKLIGQVKYNNIQSQKCFEDLGYLKKEKDYYIEYYKDF
ncbi:GNAT family N-acetyltransferase [Clostridium sporogenes]|jgi:spore coat polysaccharide biosynthesis protein SpsF|nr:GNAT family N-acetyltransferase [Clostridium lundense]NFE66111.1 GNAT family N-acetyltransferase [Clostridium sporogenes]